LLTLSVGFLTFLNVGLEFHKTCVVVLIGVLSEEGLGNELIELSFEVISISLSLVNFLGQVGDV
jgi:hypothetical protein